MASSRQGHYCAAVAAATCAILDRHPIRLTGEAPFRWRGRSGFRRERSRQVEDAVAGDGILTRAIAPRGGMRKRRMLSCFLHVTHVARLQKLPIL